MKHTSSSAHSVSTVVDFGWWMVDYYVDDVRLIRHVLFGQVKMHHFGKCVKKCEAVSKR